MLLKKHSHLIKQLTKRELLQRYQGSYLGMLWSFVTPLFMLMIYTYFFGFVFKTKWGASDSSSNLEFALILFCGLIVFNFFSEVVTKSPLLIVNNTNLVKKVVFPLQVLSIVQTQSALVHALISFVILLIGLLIMGVFHWTIIFLPIAFLPIVLVSLGLSWILSALGVFIRDIAQLVGIIVQALMFLSPIFYPISIIPENLHFIYYLNPITYVVEDLRRILIWGQLPDWSFLSLGILLGLVTLLIGHICFKRTKGGFADVL
ncbi:ABC transporter permease [Paenibacillus sp. SC116]|uniref:ABC transporter permease n=1 Tax=Paenibacillus sp. SC116 TaxID=2968986 RepID=UPI00215A6C82|nr:ABC transporter permease [Paenibacillus sp. SC116]MCR8844848.1 ABC transporter permease [Paenibacillus sp. SC116]